jgi:hypothetical protein
MLPHDESRYLKSQVFRVVEAAGRVRTVQARRSSRAAAAARDE